MKIAKADLGRRLEECRAALMNPVGDRSVTDIALAWGFGSLPTFNRTFRRAFGATPGEFRGQALSPGWPSMSEAAAAPR